MLLENYTCFFNSNITGHDIGTEEMTYIHEDITFICEDLTYIYADMTFIRADMTYILEDMTDIHKASKIKLKL